MEKNSDKSIEVLEMLDKVKERMDSCMRALKEAAKLATFSQNIESAFTSSDYLKVIHHFNFVYRFLNYFVSSADRLQQQ